ncbi:MAG: SUF system NifU family Fe-S cluster assembly protein [candidate division Zixibacteria bacterium]|nr:SUF system NifU family Fe-S cluster assembly protein [candidate division Zixibacteria bacterium]
MSSSLDDMYRDIILDHYRAPRGSKPLPMADIHSDGHNPSCGDDIEVNIQVEDDILKDIHVNCKGCAISVASGSMLAETVKGKTFVEVQRIAEVVKAMLKGDEVEIPDDLGDLDALKGVRQFPVRIKCALLAWVTLIEGLKHYADDPKGAKPSVSTEKED